jgi:hypothetical protein
MRSNDLFTVGQACNRIGREIVNGGDCGRAPRWCQRVPSQVLILQVTKVFALILPRAGRFLAGSSELDITWPQQA